MSDLERPIPENDEAQLKTILKLEESESLPQKVKELYWQVSRTARRLGFAVTGHELLLIAMLLNRAEPEQPKSFLDIVRANKVKRDDRVIAKFRGDWKWGWYKGTKQNKVLVQLDDESAEDRQIGPTLVRLPTKDELATIGE